MSSDEIGSEVPFITTDQMREVDRVMVDGYGIQLVQMMENAGRNLARLAWSRFLGDSPNRSVLVLVGTGGNGGGGLVCARHLANRGARVVVATAAPLEKFTGVPKTQLDIIQRMAIPVTPEPEDLPDADLIIDALIGYSLHGAPTGATARLIRAANHHGAPVLSLDVPSGVDASTGEVRNPAVRAVATMTLALPKTGLRQPDATPYVGELYLADISVPPRLYEDSLGIAVGSLFTTDDIVRLW